MAGEQCPECKEWAFFPKASVPNTTDLIWFCTKCGYEVELEGEEADEE